MYICIGPTVQPGNRSHDGLHDQFDIVRADLQLRQRRDRSGSDNQQDRRQPLVYRTRRRGK